LPLIAEYYVDMNAIDTSFHRFTVPDMTIIETRLSIVPENTYHSTIIEHRRDAAA